MDSPEEINRRVAEACRWEVAQSFTGGWRWFCGQIPKTDTRPTRESAERHLPDFCRDASATELLKAHMKAQGWHYQTGWGTDGARAYVDTREPHYRVGEAYSKETEGIALCLAFLAADDASKEAGQWLGNL